MAHLKPVLGMPTLLSLPDALDCAALCQRLGLSFVELNMNLPEYQPGGIQEARIRQAWEKHGIYCTLHLDELFDPCDFNPYVAQAYLRTFRESIQLALRHQMPVINLHMHPGVHFKLPEGKTHLFSRYQDHYFAALDALSDAARSEIGSSTLLICIENTDGWHETTRVGIDRLLQNPSFALTLDIGHAYVAGMVDNAWMMARKSRLKHMHIHDANQSTCHLPFGDGGLDIAAALACAVDTGSRAVVEVKTEAGLIASVEALHDYI